MRVIAYPFKPKSVAFMRQGQFWSEDLSSLGFPGWFACGRVVQVPAKQRGKGFLGGLMDWVDRQPPTAESIAGCALLYQMHTDIDAINDAILGFRDFAEDGVQPLLWLDCVEANHSNPHKRPSLMRGYEALRESTAEEHQRFRGQLGGVMSYGMLSARSPGAVWWENKIQRHGKL
jgi:hypothetical protein